MGKYMDVSRHHHQPSLGVRTRAKTRNLALQRLQKTQPKSKSKSKPCSSNSSSSSSKSSPCYLQLRSRRLEKCFTSKTQIANPNPSSSSEEIEVSLAENAVECEGKSSRNSRETTPCSLIRRDSEIVETPGSTNRPTRTTTNNTRIQSATRINLPASSEMEEFFAVPAEQQLKEFMEKYNFDPAKDCPLPGRYEWVKLQN